MEDKKAEPKLKVQRDDEQPLVLPGIRRYHTYTNLRDRMVTKNLNRAAIVGITGALAADVGKAFYHGIPEAVYCYECRACYATKERCPANIPYQAELTISSRVADYRRFIRNGGLTCLRCGNCINFCVINLDLPHIYGTMQRLTLQAMRENRIPKNIFRDALDKGLVGRDFIDEVVGYLEEE